ncbi:MAG: radical SAM protein [Spirochaetes bacterium]|nr:radical SAM protein [Spirochaetota bacterium]
METNIKYLILSITDQCNLECRYCYMGKSGSCVMTREIVNRAVEFLPQNEKCHVQISGGEPGLQTEIMRYAAQAVREHAKKATMGVQTNGTVIGQQFVDIVKAFNIQVGVSIDGRKEVNDLLRGKTDSVFKGLGELWNNDIEFRTTTVICNKNVERLFEIPFMLSAFGNARGMALDMLVRKGRAKETGIEMPETNKTIESFIKLVNTLEYVNKARQTPLTLRELEKTESKKMGLSYCHAALGESMAVAPNGDVYSCGQVIGDRNFYCGNIADFKNLILSINEHKSALTFTDNRWDCPSRIYYNRDENWPDVNHIFSTVNSERNTIH